MVSLPDGGDPTGNAAAVKPRDVARGEVKPLFELRNVERIVRRLAQDLQCRRLGNVDDRPGELAQAVDGAVEDAAEPDLGVDEGGGFRCECILVEGDGQDGFAVLDEEEADLGVDFVRQNVDNRPGDAHEREVVLLLVQFGNVQVERRGDGFPADPRYVRDVGDGFGLLRDRGVASDDDFVAGDGQVESVAQTHEGASRFVLQAKPSAGRLDMLHNAGEAERRVWPAGGEEFLQFGGRVRHRLHFRMQDEKKRQRKERRL